MGAFFTIPATLSIILAVDAFGTNGEWGAWLTSLVASSIGLFLLWPVFQGLWARNMGQLLSFIVLLAIPASIVYSVIQAGKFSSTGGSLLTSLASVVAWAVLGHLAGTLLGRLTVARYGVQDY